MEEMKVPPRVITRELPLPFYQLVDLKDEVELTLDVAILHSYVNL